jgi:MFS family permease
LVENMVKSRAQTFAIILGVFLAGLAFGGLIGDRLRDRLGRHRRTVFLASQTSLYLWLAGSVVLLIHGLEYWPAARAWLESFAAYEPAVSPGLVAANYLLLPALLLFGPALLMGFGFSLSQQLLQTSFAAVGERLGRVQFVNIVGCVVGATLTAQVAIPRVGTSGALRAVSVIGLAYAAVWCAHARRRSVPVAVAIMLVLMVMAIPPQDRLWRVLSGQVQPGLVLYREDASGVSSIRFRNMQSTEAEVFANGLGQSVLPRRLDSSHVLLGAVPTMVHAQPAQVGIIGIGSGGTLWGASARQATTRVVAWEIMASQPSLLASYAARTGETSIAWFLRDSRIDIRHGDGRHALARESDQFDVLEADAMRPSSSYAGNLYSIEFFQLARSRLRPGGLFATWVPTPRVLETVRRVFPHVVFLGELVALGSDAPIDISWPAIQARLRAPAVQAHFSAGGVDIETLMTPVFAQGPAPLAPLEAFDPLKVNTDMHPRDELPSPASILRRLLGG